MMTKQIIAIHSKGCTLTSCCNMLLPEIRQRNDPRSHGHMIPIADLQGSRTILIIRMQRLWCVINSLAVTGNEINIFWIDVPRLKCIIDHARVQQTQPRIEFTEQGQVHFVFGKHFKDS